MVNPQRICKKLSTKIAKYKIGCYSQTHNITLFNTINIVKKNQLSNGENYLDFSILP